MMSTVPLCELLKELLGDSFDGGAEVTVELTVDVDLCLKHKIERLQWSRLAIHALQGSPPFQMPPEELTFLHPTHALSLLFKAQVRLAPVDMRSFVRGSYQIGSTFYELSYDAHLQTAASQRMEELALREDAIKSWELNFLILTQSEDRKSLEEWARHLRLLCGSQILKVKFDDIECQEAEAPLQNLSLENLWRVCDELRGSLCIFGESSSEGPQILKMVFLQGLFCVDFSSLLTMKDHIKYMMKKISGLFGLVIVSTELAAVAGGFEVICKDGIKRRSKWRELLMIFQLPRTERWQLGVLRKLWPPYTDACALMDLSEGWRSFISIKKDATDDSLMSKKDLAIERRETILLPALARALSNIVSNLPEDKKERILNRIPAHLHTTKEDLLNETVWTSILFDIKSIRSDTPEAPQQATSTNHTSTSTPSQRSDAISNSQSGESSNSQSDPQSDNSSGSPSASLSGSFSDGVMGGSSSSSDSGVSWSARSVEGPFGSLFKRR